MPGREIKLANNEFYHVFNRGINSQKIFNCERDYFQFIERTKYYYNNHLEIRYSQLRDLSLAVRADTFNKLLKKNDLLIEVFVFCLMPSHFHFLVRQRVDKGISKFVSDLTNSYTRYFNTKLNKIGPIFQGKFKAVLVTSDEQMLHLSRYIHLNPYSGGLVASLNELYKYPYSSLPEYFNITKGFCQKELILNQFADKVAYKNFIGDQADYQQSLQILKHQIIES